METLECIFTRRSVRRFQPKSVPETLLQQCLEAAMSAPSAGNQQTWQFLVIEDRETLNRIPDIHPYASMVKEAPMAIIVCGDLTQEKYPGFWVQDCSAATQNLLLAAHGLGLGAVWTGIYPMSDRVESFRKMFHLPPEIIPMALLPLGFPAQKTERANRFKPDRLHRNTWGSKQTAG